MKNSLEQAGFEEFDENSPAGEYTKNYPYLTKAFTKRLIESHGLNWDAYVSARGSRDFYNLRAAYAYIGRPVDEVAE